MVATETTTLQELPRPNRRAACCTGSKSYEAVADYVDCPVLQRV